MDRFHPAVVLCLALLFTVPSAVYGQKTYALGLGGGAAIPVGKLSDVQKTGYNAIAMVAVGIPELAIGVRFDGVYNNLLRIDRSTPQGSAAINSSLRVVGVLANLIYAFPGTTAKPYVVVGGGLYNAKADVSGAKSQNNFGFNAGLGATFGVGPFAMFIESRYNTISRRAADGGVFQFVPVTAGLMF